MASRSNLTYLARAADHPHPVARRLFEIAERKRSNLIISADFTDTESLLRCAEILGPYIAVFKTHIDIVSDFDDATVEGLKALKTKHDFLIFEDRKFVDIGTTVQKQYHNGALKISEWADIVNVSILGGEGAVDAMEQVIMADSFPYRGQRAIILLAEMTTTGSLATGSYTAACMKLELSRPDFVMGCVATRALGWSGDSGASEGDFVVFTTGINRTQSGDSLGQQYQTPAAAVQAGSDFIIAGRGIYNATDSVASAKLYQKEGWDAYRQRTRQST